MLWDVILSVAHAECRNQTHYCWVSLFWVSMQEVLGTIDIETFCLSMDKLECLQLDYTIKLIINRWAYPSEHQSTSLNHKQFF